VPKKRHPLTISNNCWCLATRQTVLPQTAPSYPHTFQGQSACCRRTGCHALRDARRNPPQPRHPPGITTSESAILLNGARHKTSSPPTRSQPIPLTRHGRRLRLPRLFSRSARGGKHLAKRTGSVHRSDYRLPKARSDVPTRSAAIFYIVRTPQSRLERPVGWSSSCPTKANTGRCSIEFRVTADVQETPMALPRATATKSHRHGLDLPSFAPR